MPHDELMRNSEDYRNLFAQTGSEGAAKEQLSRDLSIQAMAGGGLATAALGAPLGAVVSRAVRGVPLATTLPRSVATGGVGEASQEFLQSGFAEQMTENLVMQQVDPTRGAFDDVVKQGVAGAASGGLMGGAQMVRFVHHICTWLFLAFIPVHIYFTIRADIIAERAAEDASVRGEARTLALGNAYGAQNRWLEAQSHYFRALENNPGDPNYAYNLAVSLEHISQPRAAISYYRRALDNISNGLATFSREVVEQRLEILGRP